MRTRRSVTDANECRLADDRVRFGQVGELFDHGPSVRGYGLHGSGDNFAGFLESELYGPIIHDSGRDRVVVGLVTRCAVVNAIDLQLDRWDATHAAIHAF